ncbi:MAG: hypothetical protein U9Q75_11815 [Pseudomonadota bacterium]|nr:hypothetical protein [Pseudomonadota bacterium]
MNTLIEQTEVELRAEISFWTKFVAEWQDCRDEPVHARAYEALDRAESRLGCLLTDQNRLSDSPAYPPVLH